MISSSCKNKGRLFQQLIRDRILAALPELEKDDIRSTSMGCGGADIQLSPAALKLFPFGVECKHTVTFRIGMWRQARMHTEGSDKIPLLFLKTNRKPPLAIMSAMDADTLFGELGIMRKASETEIKSIKVFTPTALYSIIDAKSGSIFLHYNGAGAETLLVMTCDTFFELVAAKRITESHPDELSINDVPRSPPMAEKTAEPKVEKKAAAPKVKVEKKVAAPKAAADATPKTKTAVKKAPAAKTEKPVVKKVAKAAADVPAKTKAVKATTEKKPAVKKVKE